MKKVIKLNESDIHRMVLESLNELGHVATLSPVTVCSLSEFVDICMNKIYIDNNGGISRDTTGNQVTITDNNVDEFYGKIAFIEIGSTEGRVGFDMFWGPGKNWDDRHESYKNGRFYFKHDDGQPEEHPNVLHLTFDDNLNIGDKENGMTSVSLSVSEVKPEFLFSRNRVQPNDYRVQKPDITFKLDKNGNKIPYSPTVAKGANAYYAGGAGFTPEMAATAHEFIEDNIAKAKELGSNIMFILHCAEGRSRSASMGYYVAKRLAREAQCNINDYLSEYNIQNQDGTTSSQFNIYKQPDKDGKSGTLKVMQQRVGNQMFGIDKQLLDRNSVWDKKIGTWHKKELADEYNDLIDYINNNNITKRKR